MNPKQMKNILYIHGLNSDKNSYTFKILKSSLKDYNWYTDTFDLLDTDATTHHIEEIIRTNQITTVVASSLGAFYGLNIRVSLAKILINPCMKPSIEIPKLADNVNVEAFEKMEDDIYSNIDSELRMCTYSVFGDRDELFDYSEMFTQLYGKNFIRVSGGHILDNETLLSSVQSGLHCFDELNKKLEMLDSLSDTI